jgi:hypothetical protein
MRYAAGGGLTAEGGGPPGECAAAGRIDVRAGHGRPPDREDLAGEHEIGVPVAAGLACRRHAALASKGHGGYASKLDETQLAQLRAALDLGPAAYG